MKKLMLFNVILLLLFNNPVCGQNEFGAIGSHWNYGYSPHDGNGNGWDMISIEGDTMIDGELHKIVRRTYSRTEFFPQNNTIQNSYIYGTMQIKNDSIFVNDQLILDFSMDEGDTLEINVDFSGVIKLVADSITMETINGIDHKKWHLQKLCYVGTVVNGQEYVQIIEGIGQIGFEYLFWNLDGCVVLGGGSNNFHCYRNGDFSYPEMSACEELVSTEKPLKRAVGIYPNPANNTLYMDGKGVRVIKYQIYDMLGKRMTESTSSNDAFESIDISGLSQGIYCIAIMLENRGEKVVSLFVKD